MLRRKAVFLPAFTEMKEIAFPCIKYCNEGKSCEAIREEK